ncbi:Reverse transcriptase (RNA-dependent DNA polymerase) [Popillia japonica]|uniref:Reverse transcriptase (RNA-dependent DNA polymerase) n=1 Tax=Popillia japonica TaxID=7064 RepID=A0AAW1IVI7_POPJA
MLATRDYNSSSENEEKGEYADEKNEERTRSLSVGSNSSSENEEKGEYADEKNEESGYDPSQKQEEINTRVRKVPAWHADYDFGALALNAQHLFEIPNSYEELGYSRSQNDYCLYTKIENDFKVYIVLYVDDLILCSDNLSEIHDLKKHLCKEFEMQDVGILRYFLGINIVKENDKCIRLNQRQCILNALGKFNMKECKDIATPLVT